MNIVACVSNDITDVKLMKITDRRRLCNILKNESHDGLKSYYVCLCSYL